MEGLGAAAKPKRQGPGTRTQQNSSTGDSQLMPWMLMKEEHTERRKEGNKESRGGAARGGRRHKGAKDAELRGRAGQGDQASLEVI